MISTQISVDTMNYAFKTELCMFKVNKSEFSVIVDITCHPVQASKKLPKHTQKQREDDLLGAFQVGLKCSFRNKWHRSGGFPYEDFFIRQISSEGPLKHIKLRINLKCTHHIIIEYDNSLILDEGNSQINLL